MLNIQYFNDVNYLHVILAGLAYWIIGALWYMVLFQKVWAAGVTKWGLMKGEKPDSGVMMKKMIISLLCNIGAAFLLAWFIHNEVGYSAMVGAKIGFTGALFAVFVFAAGDNWLSKPLSTFIVDATYHIAGLTLCGAIIGAWN